MKSLLKFKQKEVDFSAFALLVDSVRYETRRSLQPSLDQLEQRWTLNRLDEQGLGCIGENVVIFLLIITDSQRLDSFATC